MLGASYVEAQPDGTPVTSLTMATDWIYLAIGSGLAAGLNGLFAKLVTTTLTSSLASAVAALFSLPENSKVVEYLVRGVTHSRASLRLIMYY